MAEPSPFVLDTSALLALRANEQGADRVEEILRSRPRRDPHVLVSFMTRMEILYMVRREESEQAAEEAMRLIDTFSVEWVSCDASILNAAAALKSAGRLSVADCWIAATALIRNAILVHRDPEFLPLRNVRQESLIR